jgi:hypothetical protein
VIGLGLAGLDIVYEVRDSKSPTINSAPCTLLANFWRLPALNSSLILCLQFSDTLWLRLTANFEQVSKLPKKVQKRQNFRFKCRNFQGVPQKFNGCQNVE